MRLRRISHHAPAPPCLSLSAVWLHASFPPDYPDVPPAARLSVERGLSIEQVTELRAEMAKAIEVRKRGAARIR